jgi:hypothetical protein
MSQPRALRRATFVAASCTAGIGAAALLAWALGLFSRIAIAPPYVSIKPNTATCFVLAGASLWLHALGGGRRAARASGAAVAVVGLLTVAEWARGIDLGIDQLLFRDLPGSGDRPGRMAPVTAANFMILGGALLAAGGGRRRTIVAQVLSVIAGLVGLLGLLGYLYAVPLPHHSLDYIMALPAAIAFLACSLGVLVLHPDRGLVAVIASDSAGGSASRRLLPWVFAAPALIGWATIEGQRAGLYDIHLGIAGMVFGSIVVFLVVVWANAYPLHRLEERHRALMEQASDAILILDLENRILEANRETERLLGRSRGEIVGRLYDDFVVPEERTDAAQRHEEFLRQGALRVERRRLTRADGTSVTVEVSGSIVRLPGEPTVVVILRDITERKRAEEALREAQQRLQRVVSSSPAVLYTLKVEGRVLVPTWVSENIERFIGYGVDEVSGPAWWAERVHPEDRKTVEGEIASLLSKGHATREYRFRHKDGRFRWVRDEQVLIGDAAGPREVVGSWSDVTARKEAELRLHESEEQYRLLFDSNPHPMWVFDRETLAFLAVNDAAVRHYGYSREEFLAMTLTEIRPPEEVPGFIVDHEQRHTDRAGSYVSPRTWKHRKRDGTVIEVEIATTPIVFQGHPARLALANDITEKRNLEVQLLQSQKIESLGRLAGGVAHDFNNLLGVISGYGELLRKRVATEPRLARYVDDIMKAAERAAGLTRQLLAFSRKQVLQPRILDLNAVVAETEKMLRRLIGEDVQLMTVFDEHLGSVRADPGQMDQVLMNLAVNARDAMPRGGRLTIETSNAVLDRAYARQHPGVEPGAYVMLAVSDTGHGMTPEVLARVFEPFFTTKEQGKGTGLGLATVHGIVKQSGGHVWVYSEPGQGAAFKIYLPRVDAPAGEAAAAAEDLPRGSETILLVEDEASLRELVRECLEGGGYTVLEARNGTQALELGESHSGSLHLLMTDVVMPGMSGRDLAERLRAARPEIRILYMSGYTDDAVVLHGVLAENMAFLQKPFTAQALAQTVREVLDRTMNE